MRKIGLAISHKENEKRRALVPDDIKFIRNKEFVFIERSYGEVLGFSDDDYTRQGIGGVLDRDDLLRLDVICDPKIGDAEYLENLHNQTVFGWMHAVQNKNISDMLVKKRLTAYAWEDMYEMGRHSFWRNNEIAGEAAIMHAYLLHGVFPYNTKVAVIGRGNTARGALKILNYMGADVVTYDRRTESLFRKEMPEYDVIVNAIMWDTSRADHIIYKEDLKRLKKGAMIIDISCDRNGGIETSIPTSIESPSYIVDGIRHYVVDHTPSLFFKTTSQSLSAEFVRYADYFVEHKEADNAVLAKALSVDCGVIKDNRILEFQKLHSK